jgi:Tfp pilus assembly protein PilP
MSGNKFKSLWLFFLLTALCFAQERFVYDAHGRRNPFIPLVTADGRLLKLEPQEDQKSQQVKLEGIIYDKNGASYAVIDAEIVREQDRVGNYTVLKIEDGRVILIKDGQPLTVDLEKEGP